MSKSLRGKVNNLENSILQPFKAGSTQFCHWALPEPEQALFDKAHQLASLGLSYNEYSKDQIIILEQAHGRLRARIFDLVTDYLTGLLCRGDEQARIRVHERFLWFIRELAKEIEQELEVSEIEKKMIEEKDPVDRVDEYYRKAPDLFTRESWFELQDELFQDIAQRPGFKKWLDSAIKKGKK